VRESHTGTSEPQLGMSRVTGPGVRWEAQRAGPEGGVTVSRDKPVVVKVPRGVNPSAREKKRLLSDQLRNADRLANTLDQMEAASREVGRIAQAQAKGARGELPREPFYPAPNKTHRKKAVRQGAKTNRGKGGGPMAGPTAGPQYDGSSKCQGTDRDAWKKVDMIPANLNDELGDWNAKVDHYEKKVSDLNQNVDDLRDQLDAEKELTLQAEETARRHMQYQAEVDTRVADRLSEELAKRGFPLPPVPPPPMFQYGGYPGYPVYPPVPGAPQVPPIDLEALAARPYLQYMNDLAPRYARLRELLSGLSPEHLLSQRDTAMRYVAELETINASLQTELTKQEASIARLENTASQAGDLQKAFESLREQMRTNKAKLQANIDEKDLELIRKNEEIAQLKARSQIVVRSAEDIKAATAEEVKKVKRSSAADLAATQNAMANISAAAEQAKANHKAEAKDARRSLRAAARKIEELEKEVGTLKQQRDHYAGRAETSEIKLSTAQEQIVSLAASSSEAERLKIRTSALQQERDDAVQRATTAEARVSGLSEEIATLETELGLAREGHTNLHTEHVELSGELGNAREALEEAQRAIRELRNKHNRLEVEHNTHKELHEETKGDLEVTRAAHADLELKARAEIEVLQGELKKAVQVTEHLEKIREDQQRSAEAKMWDLKEKLDYANQSRRSLQNYAHHVRGAYKEVFDTAGAGAAPQ